MFGFITFPLRLALVDQPDLFDVIATGLLETFFALVKVALYGALLLPCRSFSSSPGVLLRRAVSKRAPCGCAYDGRQPFLFSSAACSLTFLSPPIW